MCVCRKQLIQSFIMNTQLGRKTKIGLFMVLEMIAASWYDLGSAMVTNCFCHAEFTMQCGETLDSMTEAHDDNANHYSKD